MLKRQRAEEAAKRHAAIKSTQREDEILEALEIDGVNVGRIPAELTNSGTKGRRYVSPAELSGSGFSGFNRSSIINRAHDEKQFPEKRRIRHVIINGKILLGSVGVQQLMDHETKSLDGELENRGPGMRSRRPKTRTA